jgi:LytR cell envelope-related transcriptional attenuator
MARSRSHPSLLEQSRRHWPTIAVAGAVILLLGIGFVLWPGPEPKAQAAPVSPSTPTTRITVEVLNGTRQQGAARTATRVLRRQKLDVVFLGNADSLVDSTLVVARRGDSARARHVAAALGLGAIRVETDTFRRVDVSVILGDDFQPRPDPHP